MTEFRAAPGTLADQQIDRTVAANGGRLAPSDAEVHAMLAARGIFPPKEGSSTSVYTLPERTPDAYAGVNLDGLPLPEGIDQAKLTEGAKSLGYGLQLDAITAGAVARDLAEHPTVDPDAVRAMVEKTGHSYPELLKLADEALAKAGTKLGKDLGFKAAALPVYSLVQIAVLHRLATQRAAR